MIDLILFFIFYFNQNLPRVSSNYCHLKGKEGKYIFNNFLSRPFDVYISNDFLFQILYDKINNKIFYKEYV